MKRGLAIGLMVAIAVVVGVGGFFGGRATGGGTPTPAEAMKVIQNLSQADLARLLQAQVKYVFVIFNENHSFDNEFGTFPGVNGLYSDGTSPRSAAPIHTTSRP